ncbi:glycosyltransferase family 4 protein [Thalassomonas viridans]|uniref:Glycosyltransferase family 4 protein n=1 Tax=Thalassomonas viridans TaxID=137584 RepID=A0AAE9Z0F0_9GAMM|nr:glycosyltransferase family 4 protein [Thalassomonas viridans]WDE03937.1 glycosyltransferase family 4 protein [Thalassomonas viridans]
MNILIVSNMGPKPSAPLQGQFVDKQVERLRQNLADIDYFYLSWNGDSTLHRVFKYPVYFFQFFMRYILSAKKVDIIHLHFYFPTILCGVFYKLLRNPRVKITVTCHGSDIYAYQPPGGAYRYLSRFVNHWFFTSNSLYKRFFQKLDNKTILSAGFDDEVFTFSQNEVNKQFDCLFIGTLDHNKGVDRLITLTANMPDVRFGVVGTGGLSEQLQQCANKYKNLTLLGSKPPAELANIVKASRFLISLSRNESFGLVIAEAHACGIPCIATETDGSLEQLENSPYLIAQRNIDEEALIEQVMGKIKQALNLAISDYQDLQVKAVERAGKYSLSNVISVIESRYKALYCRQSSGCKHVQ